MAYVTASLIPHQNVPNGTFTFSNNARATHRTLRLRTQKADASFLPGARVVSVLTGSDNSDFGSWTAVGTLEEKGFRAFRKHQDTKLAQVAGWAVKVLLTAPPEGIEVLESRTCARCNRRLTRPDSIHRGLGPECAGK